MRNPWFKVAGWVLLGIVLASLTPLGAFVDGLLIRLGVKK